MKMPNNKKPLPPGWSKVQTKPNAWAKKDTKPLVKPQDNDIPAVSYNKSVEKAIDNSEIKQIAVEKSTTQISNEPINVSEDIKSESVGISIPIQEKISEENPEHSTKPISALTKEPIAVSDDIKAEDIYDDNFENPIIIQERETSAEKRSAKEKTPKEQIKTKKPTVIIIVVLIAAIVAALSVFAFLHFGREKPDSNDSAIESTDTQRTEVTTATTTTSTTTVSTTVDTTTTAATTSSTAITTTSKPATVLNETTDIPLSIDSDQTYEAIVTPGSTGEVYKSPDYSSDVINTLEANEKIQVDSYFVDEYLQIWFRLKGDKGWIDEYQIKSAYLDYFNIMRNTYYTDNEEYYIFSHYDIDKDGTDEWLFQKGTSASDMEFDVYTANNRQAEYIGSIPFGTLYTTDNGELISKYEQMDAEVAYTITLEQGVLSSQLLFQNENVSEYSEPGKVLETWLVYEIFGDKDDYNNDGINADGKDTGELDLSPNVWCPECGYGFFTTGVGNEGFICPECGHNWYP